MAKTYEALLNQLIVQEKADIWVDGDAADPEILRYPRSIALPAELSALREHWEMDYPVTDAWKNNFYFQMESDDASLHKTLYLVIVNAESELHAFAEIEKIKARAKQRSGAAEPAPAHLPTPKPTDKQFTFSQINNVWHLLAKRITNNSLALATAESISGPIAHDTLSKEIEKRSQSRNLERQTQQEVSYAPVEGFVDFATFVALADSSEASLALKLAPPTIQNNPMLLTQIEDGLKLRHKLALLRYGIQASVLAEIEAKKSKKVFHKNADANEAQRELYNRWCRELMEGMPVRKILDEAEREEAKLYSTLQHDHSRNAIVQLLLIITTAPWLSLLVKGKEAALLGRWAADGSLTPEDQAAIVLTLLSLMLGALVLFNVRAQLKQTPKDPTVPGEAITHQTHKRWVFSACLVLSSGALAGMADYHNEAALGKALDLLRCVPNDELASSIFTGILLVVAVAGLCYAAEARHQATLAPIINNPYQTTARALPKA